MKMRRLGIIILIFALLLAWPAVALAQEEAPKYNFASAQGSSSLQVIPGSECRGVIYFYNVDGNRITHITLEVVEAPSDWEVEIDPPLHDIEVGFGGAIITVIENLHAEPTELSSEEIEDVPEGMVCLTLPNKLGEGIPGYALAQPAYIIIRVPESEEVGITGEIKIHAVAEWLGQSGPGQIGQTRDFDFTLTTVYEITDEEIITPGEGFDTGKWLPWIILGVVAVAAIASISALALRRREG